MNDSLSAKKFANFPNFIGGKFVPAANEQWFAHVDPLTGEASGQLADSGFMDVVRSLQAANTANVGLQKVDRSARIEMLEEWLSKLAERIEDFACAQTLDQGTTLSVARRSCARALSIARHSFNSPAARRAQSQNKLNDGSAPSRAQILAPLGVVAIISSWMDAFETTMTKLVPALVAGNVVILKGSEFAPRTSQVLAEVCESMINSALWPVPLIQVLQGKGESVGAALVIHPGIHTLSFTGQNETAKTVLRDSCEGLKRTHLSLGSRNPVLIFQEVELARLIPQVIDLCVRQTGCTRGSRIFVQEAIYKPFLAAFKTALESIQLGNPLLPETDLGPVVSSGVLERINQVVSLAISERAKLLNDKPMEMPRGGFFVAPRALYDLTYCSTIQQEEVIGPVMTITSFKYQHEAIKHAGNSPYGLVGYVFCDDSEKAQKVAEKLDVSRVILNPIGAPNDRADHRAKDGANSRTNLDLNDQSIAYSGLRGSGLGGLGFEEMLRFFSRETAIFAH